jgi:eukaryotic-like serine/threonine-protein kinase
MKVKLKLKTRSINRFFNIVLGALAMLIVALVSAFISMRLAIHGREVKVPDLTGLTLLDASKQTRSHGLILNLENRFYSPNTPPGHVLAQSPAPGVTVRREWTVRVTESLGAQQVAIPDLIGQSERTASINIRRLGLELGTVSHIAAPGDPGVVIAQTPNPNAAGVDRPRVSLLLSEPEEAASPDAYVMPSLTGLTLSAAVRTASAAGLHIVSAEELNQPAPTSNAAPATGSSTTTATPATSAQPTASPTPTPAVPASTGGTVVAQTPLAGHRVLKGDPVHITLSN